MAILYKSPLERFIESFVVQKRNSRITALYVNKAIALIDNKIESVCCTDPDGVVEVGTFRDNILTRAVRFYLNTMTREGNLKSLARIKAKLERFRDGCCL